MAEKLNYVRSVTEDAVDEQVMRQSDYGILMYVLQSGGRLTAWQRRQIEADSKLQGTLRWKGWLFNFRPYMYRYWVKLRGEIKEYWGFSKAGVQSTLPLIVNVGGFHPEVRLNDEDYDLEIPWQGGKVAHRRIQLKVPVTELAIHVGMGGITVDVQHNGQFSPVASYKWKELVDDRTVQGNND